MRTVFAAGLGLALAVPAIGSAQTGIPAEVTDGASVTLEEVRANSTLVYDRVAGAAGGPIPRERFLALELPQPVAPGTPDRALLAKLFALLDGNGDDILTRREWTDGIDRELGFADADGDGRITLEELAAARQNLDLGDALGIVF